MPTSATSASFAFAANDAGAAPVERFECNLDGAGLSACTSPTAFTGLALDRQHTFEVRAIDTLGNGQGTPASFAWTPTTPVAPPPPATPGTTTAGTTTTSTSGGAVTTTTPGGTVTATRSPSTVLDRIAPRITNALVRRGRLTFRLSEAARTTIRFQQRAKTSSSW